MNQVQLARKRGRKTIKRRKEIERRWKCHHSIKSCRWLKAIGKKLKQKLHK